MRMAEQCGLQADRNYGVYASGYAAVDPGHEATASARRRPHGADGDEGRDANATLVARVLDGLIAREFRVDFQPIVHVPTRRLLAVECLLRWQHPEYGMLLPASFAHVFQDPDVAAGISHFVLDTACAQLSELRHLGTMLPRIAVNIQPHQLACGDLARTIAHLTSRHGVAPGLIELEIVETEECATYLAIAPLLQPLRELGVRLSLDDFGTGHSCLSTLGSLHIDTVKLAREFLVQVPISERACKLAAGVLRMLERLDIVTIVEGIETASHWRWLGQYPHVYGQGYYICAPRGTLAHAIAAV
jgi:EAL domain-containing protein (putative c-di-GMP-specific phosphodiesterase class I)